MASDRLWILILFATSLTLILAAKSPKHLIVGARKSGDYLIQIEFVRKPSKWLRIVKLTKTFPGNNQSNITQVQLLDQNKKGNGATAAILTGGPDSNFVTVQFKSVRGHSIDYVVKIYGK